MAGWRWGLRVSLAACTWSPSKCYYVCQLIRAWFSTSTPDRWPPLRRDCAPIPVGSCQRWLQCGVSQYFLRPGIKEAIKHWKQRQFETQYQKIVFSMATGSQIFQARMRKYISGLILTLWSRHHSISGTSTGQRDQKKKRITPRSGGQSEGSPSVS